MRYRMIGGLVGWLVALLPLVAVNAANFAALFSFQEAILAGGLAIVIGLLLGGAAAGMVGGRQRRAYQGGASGGAATGGIAALLYLVTLFALLALASFANSTPLLLQDGALGALWMLTALAFVALLFVAVATGAGALAGRRPPRGAHPSSSTVARPGVAPRQPAASRSGLGQPLRLPSSPVSRPPSMPRPAAPDAYPGYPSRPRPNASVPRGRGASGRSSRQP